MPSTLVCSVAMDMFWRGNADTLILFSSVHPWHYKFQRNLSSYFGADARRPVDGENADCRNACVCDARIFQMYVSAESLDARISILSASKIQQ
jgi:hypothetical protein